MSISDSASDSFHSLASDFQELVSYPSDVGEDDVDRALSDALQRLYEADVQSLESNHTDESRTEIAFHAGNVPAYREGRQDEDGGVNIDDARSHASRSSVEYISSYHRSSFHRDFTPISPYWLSAHDQPSTAFKDAPDTVRSVYDSSAARAPSPGRASSSNNGGADNIDTDTVVPDDSISVRDQASRSGDSAAGNGEAHTAGHDGNLSVNLEAHGATAQREDLWYFTRAMDGMTRHLVILNDSVLANNALLQRVSEDARMPVVIREAPAASWSAVIAYASIVVMACGLLLVELGSLLYGLA
ncbi:hypothetical protein PLICRDRAFT_170679 [Plicaturopsis crispa FD-325 SS-3]|nr:hypothetical protein PLICRDRAFT_170679 [Plicaturopsis crispa FD-325 SS-3]